MANAKKCDICGAYFCICEMKTSKMIDYSFMNTITISQRDNKGNRIDTFNPMDCCPKCMENILDILNIKKKFITFIVTFAVIVSLIPITSVQAATTDFKIIS